MAVAERVQTKLGEHRIENTDLEAALEKRSGIAERRKAVNKEFRTADAEAKALIQTLKIRKETAIGRWVISIEKRPGKKVSFTVEESERVKIEEVEGD